MADDIREKIQQINRNPALSSHEKSRAIQHLMLKGKEVNPFQAEKCPHYEKKCSDFKFGCCDRIDNCHRCHKDNTECQVRPPKITEIKCDDCGEKQAPIANCVKCGLKFSENYCSLCKIWTSLTIYHCYECGICRVGDGNDYFHCQTCNGCFFLGAKDSHICTKRPMNELNCPMCLESIHSSQKTSSIAQCGHAFHSSCFRNIQDFRCPICRKSLFDMKDEWDRLRNDIQHQPMPVDAMMIRSGDSLQSYYGLVTILECRIDSMYVCSLSSWTLANGSHPLAVLTKSSLLRHRKRILCYECEQESETSFHFLGEECERCGSFNTARI
mmetsp:Transcript_3709/g.3847  ORF Transcript_3709/g.3847 Transcript_3709/m.3847 type:complete len:327 (+) Transcript_3709:181-1161(+)